MALNKISLMGRIVNELEAKMTQSGKEVVSFTLAVERNYKGADGNKITDFINCVAFGNQARTICNYFSKGRLVLIVGSLQSRQYTTQSGDKRTVFEVNADEVYFTGESKPASNAPHSAPQSAPNEDSFTPIGTDEDLPF